MDDVLIISDYDWGYTFTVLWNGKLYDDGELWDICYRYSRYSQFKEMRKELQKIGINPNEIVICSDGCIYFESEKISQIKL